MKDPKEPFVLPLKRFPKRLDRKIRFRLFLAKMRKMNDAFWSVLFAPKLIMSGASLAVFLVLGVVGLRTYSLSGESVVPGHLLYDWRRNMEITQVENVTASEERVEMYLDLSEKRLDEAEYLLSGAQVGLQLIPQASAEELEIELDEESEAAELLLESHNYQALALEELELVQDPDQLDRLTERIENWQGEYETRLNALQPRLEERDRPVFDRIVSDARERASKIGDIRKRVKSAREEKLQELFVRPEPRFFRFRRPERNTREEHFDRLRSLTKEKRDEMRRRYEALPPEEQERVREQIEAVREGLPEDPTPEQIQRAREVFRERREQRQASQPETQPESDTDPEPAPELRPERPDEPVRQRPATRRQR